MGKINDSRCLQTRTKLSAKPKRVVKKPVWRRVPKPSYVEMDGAVEVEEDETEGAKDRVLTV